VVNGAGHAPGYRSFEVGEAATSIVPWGVVIGGEELHNNHPRLPFVGVARAAGLGARHGLAGHSRVPCAGAVPDAQARAGPYPDRARSRVEIDTERAVLTNRVHVLRANARLETIYRYGESLRAIRESRVSSYEQVRQRLARWCAQAEASGVGVLAGFSVRLRAYASPPPVLAA